MNRKKAGPEANARAGNATDLASHPAPEPLQYRLITAPRGRKIWCLIHPGAVADLKKFKTVQSWRGGRLGAAGFDAELITPVKNTLTGHRAPLGLFEHPEYGPLIVKGSEVDLSEGERVSLSAVPGRFSPLKPGEARLAQATALWVSRTSVRCGVPTVPVHQAVTTEQLLPLLRKGTRGAGLTRAFWKRAGQQLTFQPYILEGEEACDLLGRDLIGWDEVTPEISDWLLRLDARLEVFDSVSGAPDRHSNNVLQVPVLLPGGDMTDVRHGIDYEMLTSRGWLSGNDSRLRDERQQLINRDLPDWERAAIRDVLSQMHAWGAPPG